MDESDLLQGRIEPDVLTEDVVFMSSIIPAFAIAFYCGFAVVMLFGIAVSTVEMLTGDWSYGGRYLVNCCWITGISSVAGLVWFGKAAVGKKLTVNRNGIKVEYRGRVLQSCRWEETTLNSTGKGWRRRDVLGDAHGVPIFTMAYNSNHADRLLVMAVARTRIKGLREVADAAEPMPRKQLSWWLLAPMFIVGMAFFPIERSATHSLVAAAGDPSASTATKIVSLIEVLVSAIGVCMSMLAIQMSAIPISRAIHSRFRNKHPELTQFIQDHKRLEAVEMKLGNIYAYVSPKSLKSKEDMLAMSFFVSLYGFGLLASPFYMNDRHSQIAITCFMLFGALMLVGAAALATYAIQIRRPLYARFKKLSDREYEVIFPSRTVRCHLIRAPKRSRSVATRLGAISLRLRGEDNKAYRLDPRYVVPVN